jgi:hypothetical protein
LRARFGWAVLSRLQKRVTELAGGSNARSYQSPGTSRQRTRCMYST